MTGATWKKVVLQATQTVWVNPWLMEEMPEIPTSDIQEAVNVLLEVLPSLSERKIEKWLMQIKEQQAEPTERQLQKLAVKRLDARTEEQIELLDAQILEMALMQMDQVHLISTNPSYHNRD